MSVGNIAVKFKRHRFSEAKSPAVLCAAGQGQAGRLKSKLNRALSQISGIQPAVTQLLTLIGLIVVRGRASRGNSLPRM